MTIVNDENAIDPILTIAQVSSAVSYSRSQIYRMVDNHTFPAPIRLGTRRVGWRRSDIVRWLNSRSSLKPSAPCSSAPAVALSDIGGL